MNTARPAGIFSIEDLFEIKGCEFILPSLDRDDILTSALFPWLPIRKIHHVAQVWHTYFPLARKRLVV